MGKFKMHLEIVIDAPNECDPEGYSIIACGRECVEKATKDKSKVTCKQCLKTTTFKSFLKKVYLKCK